MVKRLICPTCSKSFLTRYAKYCSRGCYWSSKVIRVTKKCEKCTKVFYVTPSKGVVRRFCSKKCSGHMGMTGKRHTKEHRRLLSRLAKKKGFGKWMVGRKGNKGSFKKGQFALEKHPFWKGGVTPYNQKIRQSDSYKSWRKSVFERDNYTCVWCGLKFIKGETGRVTLHADHIKPFALYPELRFELDNGRTLCLDCHKKTDTYLASTKKMLKLFDINTKA